MFKLRVKKVVKEFSVPDNAKILDVHVEFLKEKKVVEFRRFAFPFNTKEKAIKLELKKVLATYNSDHELAVKSAKAEKVEE